MKRTARLICVFLAVAGASLVANVPLGFLLDQSGLRAQGLSWTQAQGTIWSGRLSGVAFGRQQIGEASLTAHPLALVTGRLSYSVRWSGPAGRGVSDVAVGPSLIEVKNLRMDAQIAAMEGMAHFVRTSGGALRFRADRITFRNNQCKAAEGAVSSDTVTRLGAAYGLNWSEVTGSLRCEEGMLVVPIEGTGAAGETVTAEARVGFQAPPSVDARVTTASGDLRNALTFLGFVPDGDAFVYRYQASIVRTQP